MMIGKILKEFGILIGMIFFMLLGVCIALAITAGVALAAPAQPKTEFVWEHDGALVTLGYHVYCGTSSGNYSIDFPVADLSARRTLISNVIPGSGKYYCAMTAHGDEGESGYSSEIFLDVTNGKVVPNVPSAPTFRVE